MPRVRCTGIVICSYAPACIRNACMVLLCISLLLFLRPAPSPAVLLAHTFPPVRLPRPESIFQTFCCFCFTKNAQVCARAYEGVYDFILLQFNRITLFWEKSGKKAGKNADFLPCLFLLAICTKNKLNFCIYFFEKSVDNDAIVKYNIIKDNTLNIFVREDVR